MNVESTELSGKAFGAGAANRDLCHQPRAALVWSGTRCREIAKKRRKIVLYCSHQYGINDGAGGHCRGIIDLPTEGVLLFGRLKEFLQRGNL